MINHARTLLCNISGAQYQPQYLGEEYIPPEYAAVTMPSYLDAARRLIFGSRPERIFLNHRVRELMHLIHETEYAEYVYALDPRVTYWPERSPVFFNLRKYVRTKQIAGVFGAKLFFNGNIFADHATGIAFREYTVRAEETDQNTIVIEYDDRRFKPTVATVDVSSGLSTAVPISGTRLSLRIGGTPISVAELLLETGNTLLVDAASDFKLESVDFGSAGAPPSVFDGTAWRIEAFTPPTSVVNVIPALEVLGEPNFLELFGVSNSAQPFATFKNLWFDHPLAAYRLAGFALAMIYRTQEIRTKANGR